VKKRGSYRKLFEKSHTFFSLPVKIYSRYLLPLHVDNMVKFQIQKYVV